MPSDSVQYAAGRYWRYSAFTVWEPKQENQQLLQTTISNFLRSPQLSQWERIFLEGLKGRKISPRQQKVLGRIEAKLGGLV